MVDGCRDAVAILRQAATVLGPLMRLRVDSLPPEIRRVSGLHFAWWTDDGTVVVDSVGEGKAARPALVFLACQAVGGRPEAAHPAAVAVELLHNASLLHDDIIDQGSVRRGRPALWALKGIPAALLAGDALFFASVQALVEAPRSEVTLPVLLKSVQALIEGEYLDTLVQPGGDVVEDRVLAVATAKTGELLGCACALGALAGGASKERAARLGFFGRHLGIAFQCVDDLLDIWGSPKATGKPEMSDLRARRVSMPVATAMATETPQALALHDLYRRGGLLGDEECRRARALIEQTGARNQVLHRARRHLADALRHLALADPAPVPAAELTAVARLMTERDH